MTRILSVSLILLTVRSQWSPDRTYYWYNDLRILKRIVLLRRKNTWLTTRSTFTTISKKISAKNAIMTKTHNDIKTHIVTYEKEIQRKRNENTKLHEEIVSISTICQNDQEMCVKDHTDLDTRRRIWRRSWTFFISSFGSSTRILIFFPSESTSYFSFQDFHRATSYEVSHLIFLSSNFNRHFMLKLNTRRGVSVHLFAETNHKSCSDKVNGYRV